MSKEWPVIRLLDDKYRKIKQRRRHFYLVEWAGNYKPTWEPAAHVNDYLIKAYERRKKHEAATADDDSPVANKSGHSTQNVNGGGNEVQEKRGSNDQDDADVPSEESGLFVTDDDVKDGGNGVHENGRRQSGFVSDEQNEGDVGEESGSLVPNEDVKRGGNKIHGQRVGAFILSSEDEDDASREGSGLLAPSREESGLLVPNENVKRGGNKVHGQRVGAFILSSEDEDDASREESSLSVADEGVKEEKSDASKLASVPDYLADAVAESEEAWTL